MESSCKKEKNGKIEQKKERILFKAPLCGYISSLFFFFLFLSSCVVKKNKKKRTSELILQNINREHITS
jgi:hypothetical protein